VEGKATTKNIYPLWWEIPCVGQPEEAQPEGGNNNCKKTIQSCTKINIALVRDQRGETINMQQKQQQEKHQ